METQQTHDKPHYSGGNGGSMHTSLEMITATLSPYVSADVRLRKPGPPTTTTRKPHKHSIELPTVEVMVAVCSRACTQSLIQ